MSLKNHRECKRVKIISENFIHFCAFARVIVQGYHSIPEINRGSFRRLVSFQGQFVDRISGSGSFRALYTNAFSKGEALPIPSSSPIVCFLGLFVFFFFLNQNTLVSVEFSVSLRTTQNSLSTYSQPFSSFHIIFGHRGPK